MDSPRFHVVEISPKRKSFHAVNHIEHVLQLILALPWESIRHRIGMYADNARSHTARQSQELCQEKSLRITVHPGSSSDFAPAYFFY
jgi:hypothetical protein